MLGLAAIAGLFGWAGIVRDAILDSHTVLEGSARVRHMVAACIAHLTWARAQEPVGTCVQYSMCGTHLSSGLGVLKSLIS